jgi:tetratricopeptide (TPR) repeat protein
LRQAIAADPDEPDAVVILRLALALDQQKKYQDALEQANRAVNMTKEDTDIGKTARNERERLVIETGGSSSANGAPPSPAAPQSAPQSATVPGH